jgi:pimeloyl-ACP methyl ester carboxylesterase
MTLPSCMTRFTEVQYLEQGPSTGPPVVLAHGFPDVPATWDDVVSLLPAGLRIIRPYLRGVGGSRVVDGEARSGQVPALATDLLEFVDALELESFVLVGHDWGARASHALTALAPERVRGLVTIATAYGPASLLAGRDVLDEAAAAWYRYWLCTATGADSFRSAPKT